MVGDYVDACNLGRVTRHFAAQEEAPVQASPESFYIDMMLLSQLSFTKQAIYLPRRNAVAVLERDLQLVVEQLPPPLNRLRAIVRAITDPLYEALPREKQTILQNQLMCELRNAPPRQLTQELIDQFIPLLLNAVQLTDGLPCPYELCVFFQAQLDPKQQRLYPKPPPVQPVPLSDEWMM